MSLANIVKLEQGVQECTRIKSLCFHYQWLRIVKLDPMHNKTFTVSHDNRDIAY